MRLSHSKASTYNRCPRLFYYQYRRHYKPVKRAPWFVKGDAYDKLLGLYDTEGLDNAKSAIPGLFPNEYDAANATFLLTFFHHKFKDDIYPPAKIGGPDGEIMGNQFPVECRFVGNAVTDSEFTLNGFLDKLSKRLGECFIIERKTTTEAINPGSSYWNKLPLDPQTRGYSWAVRELLGVVPTIVYEVVRKVDSLNKMPFMRYRTVKGEKVFVPIGEYTDRLYAMGFNLKDTLVDRNVFKHEDDDLDEWATNHALTAEAIKTGINRQRRIEAGQIDGAYAWPQNTLGCDTFGGCTFKPVCENKTTLEEFDEVKEYDPKEKVGG